MASIKSAFAFVWVPAFLWMSPLDAQGADVRGYSVLKGLFQNQTDANTLEVDPDFGYCLLASVDLTDFYLVTDASFRLPGDRVEAMDDIGDFWAFMDSRSTFLSLNTAFGWGTYTFDFTTANEGSFTCALTFPTTPLPPTPRLLNFSAVQEVNPSQPLRLEWDFSAMPRPSDFVQVYINHGHDEIFSTPDLDQPGALDGTARSVTLPAGTLEPGRVYSLNLEITRVVSTNAASYPGAPGVAGTFSSTALTIGTMALPRLRLAAPPANGALSVEVWGAPDKTVVLQGTDDWKEWRNLATNSSPSGTNLFVAPVGNETARIFRVWQP
jgi:hypothetical protein